MNDKQKLAAVILRAYEIENETNGAAYRAEEARCAETGDTPRWHPPGCITLSDAGDKAVEEFDFAEWHPIVECLLVAGYCEAGEWAEKNKPVALTAVPA